MWSNSGELKRIEQVLSEQWFSISDTIQWICVCIQDQLGNILVSQERGDKPRKREWQYWITIWKCQKGESYSATAIREVREETFMNITHFSGRHLNPIGYIYATNWKLLIPMQVFHVLVDSLRFKINFPEPKAELMRICSMSIKDFLNMKYIRPFAIEALFLIQKWLSSLKDVIPNWLIWFWDWLYTPWYVKYPCKFRAELLKCLS